jgi:hypothetical protein
MFKPVGLWSAPRKGEEAAFETTYLGIHAPLARAILRLAGLDTIEIGEGLEGSAPTCCRVAIMSLPDRAAFRADEHTPQWTALRADAGQMIERFGVTLTSSMGQDG